MERVLLNLILILGFIYLYRLTRHGIHMLQLESYYLDRYAKWMKKNVKKVTNVKAIILLLITSILVIVGNEKIALAGLILEIVFLIFLTAVFKRQNEKKPLVATARVKRMYGTYLVLFIVLAICGNIFNYKIALIVLNLWILISYLFVGLVNIINSPIEKSIKLKFLIKAKNKLKEIPDLKVVGITGSYGKTSTKYIVNTILSQKYNTLMTPESYNTPMGVVRTINEKLSSMHQLFICEMGAKYVGDIKEITDIVNPTYGILTAIGPQHLDTFKSLENIKKTKLELIDSLPDDDGIAFVNWEDENIRSARILKKTVKYGLSSSADYYAKNIEITERGSSFDVVMPNKEVIQVRTKLLGNLNILNIVAAVAIADKLGLTADEIKVGIKYIKPVTHRLELKQNPNGSIIIDDAYNSNIKGAEMALDVLKTFKDRQRILITPGIVELGDKSTEINKNFGKKATECSDFIILVGANQAVPIYNGIKEKNYPLSKVYIANNLTDALNKMNEIMTKDSVVLFENDLPDNYL